MKDLERFIMNKAKIIDKRSIQSRIRYLKACGIIQTYAPNMYTISLVGYEKSTHTHKILSRLSWVPIII